MPHVSLERGTRLSMISILLDPWLVQFSSNDSYDDMNAKMGSLKCVFDELQKRYPLQIVPFMNPEEAAEFWSEFPKCKFVADKSRIVMYINSLSMTHEPPVGPAKITDRPCPNLSGSWLKVLAVTGNTDTPPSWRSPMVLLSNVQKSNWPEVDEINYTHEGSNRRRNLVPIERYRDHKFFITDIDPLDPWRLDCVGLPISQDGSREQKRCTWKRLPCPPSLARTRTLPELMERLRGRFTFTTTDTNFFYVPSSEEWNPLNISKQDWRDGQSFPTGSVSRGPRKGESGPLDRGDRIWVWHDQECHWDVQFNEGATHINVSHTGKNLSV